MPEHDPVMLGNLLNSFYRQLDDVVEVLLPGRQVLRVDVLSFERSEE
jgi:hypothetical protein